MADDEEPEGGQHGDRGEGEEPGGPGVRALAERVGDAEHPGQRGPAVQALPARDADPGAEVVGHAERDQAPAGHDPDRHPRLLVAGDERQRDVEHALVQERIAEQRDRVHEDRDQRRERERLVGGAQVDPAALDEAPAHRQTDADRRAREHESGGAGGAGDDPEQVLFHGGAGAPATFELAQRNLGISGERAPSSTRRRRTATSMPAANQIASEARSPPSTLPPGTKQAENASTRCLSGKNPARCTSHDGASVIGNHTPEMNEIGSIVSCASGVAWAAVSPIVPSASPIEPRHAAPSTSTSSACGSMSAYTCTPKAGTATTNSSTTERIPT